MKITKEYNWSRRDFCFDAKCEGCGHVTVNNSGYDDSYFRNEVVPDTSCEKCGQSSKTLNTAQVSATKYSPDIVI